MLSPVYAAYYTHIFADAQLLSVPIPATEVAELIISVGMFSFALHGALRPNDIFSTRDLAETLHVSVRINDD